MKNDVPELWRQRHHAGLCPVCGKDKSEFEGRMRVYCSVSCREEYASKYTSWTEVRSKILNRDKSTCQECGANSDKLRKEAEKKYEEELKLWIRDNKETIQSVRDACLVELSKRFQQDYDIIMGDRSLVERHCWKFRSSVPEKKSGKYVELEIDHIKAVCLGGDMWDEENLRALCIDCHKKKTKSDLKYLKKIRDNKKHGKLELGERR